MGLDLNRKHIVVAMDHARYFGVTPGLQNPGAVLDKMVDAGADAIMTSYGVIKHYQDKLIGRIPTIMRLDGGMSAYREDWLKATEWRLLHTVEDARALGVDGVCVMLFMGAEVELQTMEITARVCRECLDEGMTVMVEALPCPSPKIWNTHDATATASACRLAFEHGADIVKTYYTGDAASFRTVIDNCPVPTMIAGGPRMDTGEAVLNVVRGAMAAGAKGVVFGRNIWQNANPPGMVRALAHIIHEGGSATEAARLLRS
ncbi:MAG: fructose-bisphosphate aldolase [Gammaproteobacteria bacterium]